jgi:dipeptidyl aminopeptidase/acylaminoacyl peptidase
MSLRTCAMVAWLVAASSTPALEATPFDAAAAFGARQGVVDLSLSPDGKGVAYLIPTTGQGSALLTLDLAAGSKARVALTASGKPDRLTQCHWVSNDRLACTIYGLVQNPGVGILPFSRVVAVDRSGSNLKLLSTRTNEYTRGYQLGGGSVIDWLPDEDSAVLMTRVYLPDEHLGSHVGSWREGLAVDRLDTRTLQSKTIEFPARDASTYITDGRGTVRVIGRSAQTHGDQDSGIFNYFYRKQGSRDWQKLDSYNSVDRSGFAPYAIDPGLDIVYGIDRLMRSLARALPRQPQIRIVDSSVDERVLLIFAGSDDDPGVYYVFDRPSKELHTFVVVRGALEGVKLANVKPVSYPAADGEMVPGYLTLPPGMDNAKGLPAIVLPHGGPSARDVWGFDWLSQFYASRGFAVLQPNFRGSAGYGDAWLHENGFRSWRIAIGDVIDAGHWLVAQGIADPAKLCIVGWSYGGYAAIQSAVTDPSLFRAVVAIAPVTDLESVKEEWRHWSNFSLVSDEIGEGPYVREGSPARNADKIKVPVLLFHGALDRNVGIAQSRLMAARLESAGVKHELVTWDDLDHYLDDSTARTQMLRSSEAFLRQAIGEVH